VPISSEDDPGRSALLGMPDNLNIPGRRKSGVTAAVSGDGSVGDAAFRDGVIIVLLCWAVLFALAYSLRRHIA
jgi:hypothetical protein